jgi:hypothetical protein
MKSEKIEKDLMEIEEILKQTGEVINEKESLTPHEMLSVRAKAMLIEKIAHRLSVSLGIGVNTRASYVTP